MRRYCIDRRSSNIRPGRVEPAPAVRTRRSSGGVDQQHWVRLLVEASKELKKEARLSRLGLEPRMELTKVVYVGSFPTTEPLS